MEGAVATLPKAFSPEPPKSVPLEKKPSTPTYSGEQEKMSYFNGEKDGVNYAIDLKLRTGEQQVGDQDKTLAFRMDPNDPQSQRIVNLDDIRNVATMPPEEAEKVAIFQQQGDQLTVSLHGKKIAIAQDALVNSPHRMWFTDSLGIEVLNFDPQGRSIKIRKITPATAFPPIASGTLADQGKGVLEKVARLVTAAPIAAGLVGGDMPREMPPPPAYVETTSMPSQEAFAQQVVVEKDWPKETVDASLKCPAVKERSVKEGDSLSGLLIQENGLKRYLTEDGKLNEDQVYKDILCTINLKQNREQLRKSDPKLATALDDLEQHTSLTGPITSDMLRQLIEKVNQPLRFEDASRQLLLTYIGDTWYIASWPLPEVAAS